MVERCHITTNTITTARRPALSRVARGSANGRRTRDSRYSSTLALRANPRQTVTQRVCDQRVVAREHEILRGEVEREHREAQDCARVWPIHHLVTDSRLSVTTPSSTQGRHWRDGGLPSDCEVSGNERSVAWCANSAPFCTSTAARSSSHELRADSAIAIKRCELASIELECRSTLGS